MSFRNRICLFIGYNIKLKIEGRLNPTSFINGFNINFQNTPFFKISEIGFFNRIIFFIYNIRSDTRSRANRRVGSK